jgi:hypothetical protein
MGVNAVKSLQQRLNRLFLETRRNNRQGASVMPSAKSSTGNHNNN